jgi:phage tail-like protein
MPTSIPRGEDRMTPLPGFAFHVAFATKDFDPIKGMPESITGGFSDVSGLEATMEAKAIKVGGRNYGAVQRAGPVTFGTVVLKRGIVEARHLWAWWALFAGADRQDNGGWAASSRCDVTIALIRDRKPVLGWTLERAMPIKFRAGDLNARGTEVAVEELHLVHEGLHMRGVA